MISIPIVLIFIILILLFDRQNPLFSQIRTGLNYKSFKIYKLKSMKLNKDTNILEVTKIGSVMRLFKIDELLQLLNVLNNDMSIIGPRPLLPAFNYFYKKNHSQRLFTKPGITGLAQIKIRDSTNWNRKFNFDSIYVKKISFKLDFYILLKTFHVVVQSIINPKKRSIESSEYSKNFFENYK